MKIPTVLFALASVLHAASADALADGFASPPAQTQPWCYWYWISDNISKEGITKDLEGMAKVGIGEALIGNIYLDEEPKGKIKVLSEEWWSLVEHAIREGGRLGVNIGLFNCPGWSQSGGPWITEKETMRHLVSSDTRVIGPTQFSAKLAVPAEPFQDVALMAFPAPAHDADVLKAKISVTPAIKGDAGALADGDIGTMVTLDTRPLPKTPPIMIDMETEAPLTARSLSIVPGNQAFAADCKLEAENDGKWTTVRTFRFDRSNMSGNVGPMPRGPVAISFPEVSAKHFRLSMSNFSGRGKFADLAEIDLSPAARLEGYVEQQLGKMHPTPLPMWDTYLWKSQTGPVSPELAVTPGKVIDLSGKLAADGTLTWSVPQGDWVIQRIGMTPTGMKNAPASPEGQGLEVDKMNRALVQKHFDAFAGQLLKRMPAEDRKAFKHIVGDSYEMGSENWTDGFGASFQKRYGYDPKPWLPVLSGRIVGDADQSGRFLWDLRRLVADRVATDYVGGLKDAAKEQGLGLWLENYGHWGFPGEFLKYGGASDRIAGEFWVTGELGSIECRAASSAANTYGKPFVSAESFTGGPPFQNSPRDLKARGDWSFCEGINHVVLHVSIEQPYDDKVPGMNAPWGTEFNRHNTWFDQADAWVDYEKRCCWMLQQGWRVTDVAYFIGSDAPKMTGVKNPPLPAGRDFDYINEEVIERDLAVKDGMLALPHGVSYRVLVLPELSTMRPEVLKKIHQLLEGGATVLGPRPERSPSLQNYPNADAEVRDLASKIWGGGELGKSGEHAVGKGRIVWGKNLDELFAESHTPADVDFRDASKGSKFLFTHRRSDDADVYFISNQKPRDEKMTCAFRISGKQPELWNPVSGERRELPAWSEADGMTAVPLEFAPNQSWFVVFQKDGKAPENAGNNFPAAETVLTLEGAWNVAFDPKWGGPAAISFAALADWTKRPEEGVKFYSGTATYSKSFEMKSGGNLTLDLGNVRDLATVTLNGQNLGTLWTPPWKVDISKAAKPGTNELKIQVTNPWNNRLVRDASLPQEERLTWLSLQTVKPKSPLRPAGLLGPVKIETSNSK